MKIDYFCIHHPPAKSRKEYIIPFFETLDSKVTWVEYFWPQDKAIECHPVVNSPHSSNGVFLNPAELSCFFKHRYTVKMISESTADFGVVFEDDIEIPSFNWEDYIQLFTSEVIRHNCDILFIGSFSGSDINPSFQSGVYAHKNLKSRCAHCYMISPKIAKMIGYKLLSVKEPFDWQLNSIISDLNLNVGWSLPHVNQRTEKGKIPSLLR